MSDEADDVQASDSVWDEAEEEFDDSEIDAPVVACSDGTGGGSKAPPWTVADVKKTIAKTDPQVIKALCDGKISVVSFDTAYDKWRYDDGHVEERELKGLMGNTRRDAKEIRLRKSMSVEEAAATLFHEMGHATRTAPTTEEGYLQEEIDVRVDEENFRIRQKMPESSPGYRKPDGTVDRDFIEKEIKGSPHYNPVGRERIGRRYVGETPTTGWCPP